MNMRIRDVVIYNASGEMRRIAFRKGVNVITGRSGTGKSAIIDIVDFCLGRAAFTIPEGVIRDHVAWFAVVFTTGETDVCVAKPTPKEGADSQRRAHFQVGSDLDVPPMSELRADSNDESVVASISGLLGMSGTEAQLPEGSSRQPYQVHLRHAAHYLYQPESIIANRDVLFFRQQEDWATQTIRDTLPYFLGAVTEERIALVRQLRRARRELGRRKSEFEEYEQMESRGLRRGRALLMEAVEVGILDDLPEEIPADDVLLLLSEALEWTPDTPVELSESQIPRLQKERESLSRQLASIGDRIAAARAFIDGSGGYATEAEAQVRRLESVGLFPHLHSSEAQCPICSSPVGDRLPELEAVQSALNQLSQELSQVERERPQIRKHIADLEAEQEETKGRIEEVDLQLRSLVQEVAVAREFQDQNARAARVVGRISLYLDTVTARTTASNPQQEYEVARRRVDALAEELEDWDVEEVQESYLNRIGIAMTSMASRLPFEHKEWPLRLDAKKVTVVADRPGRPFPMSRMGSGQNFLICHVACLLALHEHFRKETRPVPSFLILDQPTQVYFPSREEYSSLSGSVEDTDESAIDLVAVQQLFDTIFDVVDSIGSGFQVIILEHANLEMGRFQDALVETPWQDRGLVPNSWIGRG